MEAPETAFATAPDGVNIAYQVAGEGPEDLVFVPGWISNVDLFWELPATRRFFSRLASFCRLIVFDKRGTGLSDPIDDAAPLETRMGDMTAVMEAAGSERAAVCGYSEGAALAAVFAATYPERVSKLLLAAPAIAPSVYQAEIVGGFREQIATGWGEGTLMELFLPNHAHDPRVRSTWARTQRLSATRGTALKTWDVMIQIDARPALPSISAPTLLIARRDDPVVPIEGPRAIAAEIPGARLAELPGNDHLPWVGDQDEVLDPIEEFITGRAGAREPDRALATVLFTDIVGSTQRAAELGDRGWRELLGEHERIARRELERYDGRLVKTIGDGALATFDGPARGIRSACAIRDAATRELGLDIRAGLHTGECELIGDDIGGVAVHIAARVSAEAGPGEVLVSRTVRDLIAGSGVELADRGVRVLKGVPDEWNLYAVVSE